jgi:RHS repeat-associated protein
MIMPGRSGGEEYRYGFNGMEGDDEAKGAGNSLDFGARIYDTRLGRFLSVDPLSSVYVSFSSYLFAANSPILLVDVNGEGPGGPDEFRTGDCMCSETLEDGTNVTYVSQNLVLNQQVFENPADGLLTSVNESSYWTSTYGIDARRWAPAGEFGSVANRQRVIDAFEELGAATGVSSSYLYTIAAGEGMIYNYRRSYDNNLDVPVNSFLLLGLDFFGSEIGRLPFNSLLTSGGTHYSDLFYTAPALSQFADADYLHIFHVDGSPFVRDEGGGPTAIYPVWFKDFEAAARGAGQWYAHYYNEARRSATALGWGELDANQSAFYGYFKIHFSNRAFSFYGFNSKDFMSYDPASTPQGEVPYKAYERFVAWRRVLYKGDFSN